MTWITLSDMEKLYYTIGEAAEVIGESVSLVRYWSDNFSRFLKPHRNAKGNRLYTADDIEVLKQIYHLVKVNGMTLPGASKKMLEDRKSVESRVKAVDSLKSIRQQLVEIRKTL